MAYNPNHKGAHNYDDAILSYKIANAAKTRRDEWFATDERAQEILDYVCGKTGFLGEMFDKISNYGAPTPAQRNAIIQSMSEYKARQAEYDAEKARSQYVGVVGERQAFKVQVVHKASYETAYGTIYVTMMKSGDDMIVAKGTSDLAWLDKGDIVEFMARVKSHEDRRGTKQTVVTRPTKIKITGKAQ